MVVNKSLASGSLAEAIDAVFGKGVVVDTFMRIALAGSELIPTETGAVIPGAEACLRYAEAADLITEPVAR